MTITVLSVESACIFQVDAEVGCLFVYLFLFINDKEVRNDTTKFQCG